MILIWVYHTYVGYNIHVWYKKLATYVYHNNNTYYAYVFSTNEYHMVQMFDGAKF